MEHTFTLLSLLLCQVTFSYTHTLSLFFSLSSYTSLSHCLPSSYLPLSAFHISPSSPYFFFLSISLSRSLTLFLSLTLSDVFSVISFFYLFRQWPALGPSQTTKGGSSSAEEVSTVEKKLRKKGEREREKKES
jgi:hypothetical protein